MRRRRPTARLTAYFPARERVRQPDALSRSTRRPDPDHNEIEARGEEIGAIFHSHPKTEAAPVADRRQPRAPTGPGALWLICSLADDEPVVRGFDDRRRPGRGGRARCRVRPARASRSPARAARAGTRSTSASAPTAGCRSSTSGAARRSRSPRRTSGRARSSPQYTGGELVKVARRPQPGRGGADPGHPARGGDPERPAAHARVRRPRLPGRRPARHPRSRGRRRGRPRAARRHRPSTRAGDRRRGDERPLRLLAGMLIALASAALVVWVVLAPDRLRRRYRTGSSSSSSSSEPARGRSSRR